MHPPAPSLHDQTVEITFGSQDDAETHHVRPFANRECGSRQLLSSFKRVIETQRSTSEVMFAENAEESRSGNSSRTFLRMLTQDCFDLGL
jgi:hypothetical protein